METRDLMAASNLTNFAGQVVLVTGAASGIGKAAAELIAQRGGKVICLDLNEDGLKTTVAKIEQAGGAAGYKVLDVSSQSGVKKVVAEFSQSMVKFMRSQTRLGSQGQPASQLKKLNGPHFRRQSKLIFMELSGLHKS